MKKCYMSSMLKKKQVFYLAPAFIDQRDKGVHYHPMRDLTRPTFLDQFLVYNSHLDVDRAGEGALPRYRGFCPKAGMHPVNELSMTTRRGALPNQPFLDQFLV